MNRESEFLSRLRAALDYNQSTGVFTWKVWRGFKARAGSVAGATDSKGHRQIRFEGKLYLAHRLAWFMTYGRWPTPEADHKNGIRADNRIENLREVTHHQNSMNRGIYQSNSSGVPGVCWYRKTGKWTAYIREDGKNKNLGYFEKIEDAARARKQAEQRVYGKFSRGEAK